MPSSRHELLSLQDILEACVAIERFLLGVDPDRFKRDDLVQAAVLHKL